MRWQAGTALLPPGSLGHIGYAVVPWKRGQGYASRALHMILGDALALSLPYVDLTTNEDNLASQRIIEKARGQLIEKFNKPVALGGAPSLRYRIYV